MKKHLLTVFAAALVACYASADVWMQRLPDNAYLDQLSIPGTHDSATGNGTTLDSFAQTQELTVSEQFGAGIRAFDLRPSVDGNDLKIYHGVVATKLSFSEAMGELCRLLDENPSEFVVVIMRHEDDHESAEEKALWNGLMAQYLASSDLSDRLVKFNRNLTVGDMRGKILLLSRDRYADKPLGGFINNWTHSPEFAEQSKATITGESSRYTSKLCVQDFYETNNAMDTKLASLTALLNHSVNITTSAGRQWVINHTSGYSASLFATADAYRKNAASTNPAVIDYLADESHAGPTGLIMMDFAGVDKSGLYEVAGLRLINSVIDNNFRYDMLGAPVNSVSEVFGSDDVKLHATSNGEICGSGLIELFTLDGTLVATGVDLVSVSIPGIYIAVCGADTLKVVVR